MSVTKPLGDDKTFCKSIAKSISEIIRFSLNEEFRKKSFKLFEVSNTKDTEEEINKRLLSLVQNKTMVVVSQSKNENSSTQKGKEGTDEGNDYQSNSETLSTPSASSDSNSQTTSQFFKRNWLQISSQQYREVIKRKKLKYYSQPQLNETKLSDFEPHSFRSDSQQSSSSSLLSDEKMIFSEPLSDNLNYCREKFRDSFRNNAQKYFRKNLKSQKFVSEATPSKRKFSF